jgi:hypothetical protein
LLLYPFIFVVVVVVAVVVGGEPFIVKARPHGYGATRAFTMKPY